MILADTGAAGSRALIGAASVLVSLAVLVLLAGTMWHVVGSPMAEMVGTDLLIPGGRTRALGQGALLGGSGLVLVTVLCGVE